MIKKKYQNYFPNRVASDKKPITICNPSKTIRSLNFNYLAKEIMKKKI